MKPSLEELNLSDNELRTLPPQIVNLIELRHLNLSRNQLDKLPLDFPNLELLAVLDLSHNQLKELPGNWEKMAGMYQLFINHNQFSRLPDNLKGIGADEAIEVFVHKNQITELPKWVFAPPYSVEIGEGEIMDEGWHFGDNPIQSPPPELIMEGREAVLQWFEERERKK